jgi:hypothetical protein
VTMLRGEFADPLQPASGRPGRFSAQRSYKVYSDKMSAAGILRQSDCAAVEHEHPEAQLSILFRGDAASLLTHDESGKTTKTGIVAESFFSRNAIRSTTSSAAIKLQTRKVPDAYELD